MNQTISVGIFGDNLYCDERVLEELVNSGDHCGH